MCPLLLEPPSQSTPLGCYRALVWVPWVIQQISIGYLFCPSGACPQLVGASLVAQMVKNLPANTGGPGSIPGSGRSLGEGIGYPLQYSWASLVTHLVKNLPAMQETWVWSLGQEDPLEEGMTTHSSIPAWRIPMDRGAWWATVHGVAKSQTWLRLSTSILHTVTCFPVTLSIHPTLSFLPHFPCL